MTTASIDRPLTIALAMSTLAVLGLWSSRSWRRKRMSRREEGIVMQGLVAQSSPGPRAYRRICLPWDESKLAFTVDAVLNADECAALRARSEAAGFSPSPMAPLQKGHRARFDDGATAKLIFERLRGFLPPVWRRSELVGLTPTFRFIRYCTGDEVLPHPDTSGGDRHTPVSDPSCSYFTCLLNLNDAYDGCETHLLPSWANSRLDLWPKSCASDGLRVAPGTGRALVFEHDVVHGCPPLLSGVKYQLRLDVCYSPRDLDGRRLANPFRDPTLPAVATDQQRPGNRAVLKALAAAAKQQRASSGSGSASGGSGRGGSSGSGSDGGGSPGETERAAAGLTTAGGSATSGTTTNIISSTATSATTTSTTNTTTSKIFGAKKLRLADRIRLQQAADAKRRSAPRPVIGGAPARDRFAGHVAVVTGASSGVGAAVARALAVDLGMVVLAAARRLDRLEALAAAVDAEITGTGGGAGNTSGGGRIVPFAADVTDDAAVAALFAAACTETEEAEASRGGRGGSGIGGSGGAACCPSAKRQRRILLVVACAGVGSVLGGVRAPPVPSSSGSSSSSSNLAVWREVFAANVVGTVATLAGALAAFERDDAAAATPVADAAAAAGADVKDGEPDAAAPCCVVIGSLSGRRVSSSGASGGAAYAASKHAVAAAVEAARLELRASGLRHRVGLVSPGLVASEFHDVMAHKARTARGGGSGGGGGGLASAMCDGLDPRDVAAAVLFMATAPDSCEVHEILLRPTSSAE